MNRCSLSQAEARSWCLTYYLQNMRYKPKGCLSNLSSNLKCGRNDPAVGDIQAGAIAMPCFRGTPVFPKLSRFLGASRAPVPTSTSLFGTTPPNMSHATSPLDAAQGALLGAACGDSAGGVLEFGGPVSAARAAWALGMPGGGQSGRLHTAVQSRLGQSQLFASLTKSTRPGRI